MKTEALVYIIIILFINTASAQDISGFRYPVDPAQQEHSEIPKGKVLEFEFSGSKVFPGTKRTYWVYIPAQYNPDKPPCLYVNMDGIQFYAPKVFDYMINKGEMPVTIGVFISSGEILDSNNKTIRYNRSHEFDSMNPDFVNFLLNELLPDVEKQITPDGKAIKFSEDANDRAIAGVSSGAICAFTAAWQRPDQFSRVFSAIGTFVGMRGGDQYPVLIRKTEPKPIRIFLQDGSADAWNPLFGSWYAGNLNMEAALSFAGYEVNHSWGTGGHAVAHSEAIFPDVMRWLWKGWPQKIQAGKSNNDMLSAILADDEAWQIVNTDFKTLYITNTINGHVLAQDALGNIHGINTNQETGTTIGNTVIIGPIGCGPDGKLYLFDHKKNQLLSISSNKKTSIVAKNISGNKFIITEKGNIYITISGGNGENKGGVLLIKPNGDKEMVDTGLQFASAVTISPDRKMLLVAEDNTNWIYNYIIQKDGSLTYKQKWYWLHQTDMAGYNHVANIAMDNEGNLYAATNLGIQVCDQNGRVRAILQPPGTGPVSGLCFGGPNFDTLFVICDGKLYKRKLKVIGVPEWAAPVYPKSIGGG